MADPDLCPWPDFNGNPIRHGDRMWHPVSGQTFTAVRLHGIPDPGNAWRAIYDSEDPVGVSRLCLQIGDKGMAVLLHAGAVPAKPPGVKEESRAFAVMLMRAAGKSGDPGAITLAAQLAGVPACIACGYVVQHCRCGEKGAA